MTMFNLKKYQDLISLLFYKHGLMCASYPFAYIFGVIAAFLIVCYPLVKMPFPGNAPLQFVTPLEDYKIPPAFTPSAMDSTLDDGDVKKPRWYHGSPVAYVQQIVVKSTILPWNSENLLNSDAMRASLSTVFELLEHIDNFQLHDGNTTVTLSDLCFRVSEIIVESGSTKMDGLLPEYNCLLVSPARFWKQDRQRFLADTDLLGTVFKKYGMVLDSPTSIKDVLFGVPWMKKYHLRKSKRVFSYAITFALHEYNHRFLVGLNNHLRQIYPLKALPSNGSSLVEHLVHVHYQSQNYIVEYTPLIFAYIVLCLYLYFSVRKIEMVKSKWGLALSAMVTVVASLLMSVSLCVFLGLTPSLNGSEIFPYLVVIIGLENILVITKSVVSTPVHLDVKLRIALGLQKEGWYIFKNLVTELFILAVGFFTFVPAIQEFCLFAVLGLGSDFFLQMFFFTTVLSVDIRRMELSDLQRRSSRHESYDSVSYQSSYNMPSLDAAPGMKQVQRLHINSAGPSQEYFLQLPTPSTSFFDGYEDVFSLDSDDPDRLPRRMRLIHFWARYRILQRGIMICVIIWIFLILYKTSLVEETDDLNHTILNSDVRPEIFQNSADGSQFLENASLVEMISAASLNLTNPVLIDLPKYPSSSLIMHESLEQWRHLSSNHWKTIFGYYNISLFGRYLTILPSIHLSIGVSPETAINIRNPIEASNEVSHQWDKWSVSSNRPLSSWANQMVSIVQRLVRYPRTRLELVMTILLGIASIILLLYMFLFLYKCICSRKYARWRSTWQKRLLRRNNQYYKQIRESTPLILKGHVQEVECVSADGQIIASSCLGGEIRVWDSESGECLRTIDRTKISVSRQRLSSSSHHGDFNSVSDLSSACSALQLVEPKQETSFRTSWSQNSLDEDDKTASFKGSQTKHQHSRHKSVDFALASMIPDLTETIDTDFRSFARQKEADSGAGSLGSSPTNGYDFTQFQSYFEEHRKIKEAEQLRVLRKRGHQGEGGNEEEYHRQYERRTDVEENNDNYYAMCESINSLSDGAGDVSSSEAVAAAIWCLALKNNCIVVGCGNGNIEFWDTMSGRLKSCYNQNKSGVTAICVVGSRVIAARIDGMLDFLLMNHLMVPLRNSCNQNLEYDRMMQCSLLTFVRAHQQPINLLLSDDIRVVTASQDHTLKVYRIDDAVCLYTLHGHTAGVTALALDKITALTAVSGSVDASIRLWDLQTGSCVHKLVGHNATVTSVTFSPNHLVSVGMDDRLCIWDRSRGHLLHCMQMDTGCCNTVAVLTKQFIITGGQGSLHLWDINKGSVIRVLSLGDYNTSVFVRQLLVIDNSVIVCDYGPQLRVVRFTLVLEKDD